MPKWVNLLRLWLRHLWLRIVAEGSFETGRSRSFRGIFSFFDINFIFCGFIKKLKISHFQKSFFWDFLRTPAKNQKMFFPKIKPHGEPDNLILHTQPAQTHLCGYLHKKPKSKLGFILFTYDLPNFLYQGRFHLASLGLKPPGYIHDFSGTSCYMYEASLADRKHRVPLASFPILIMKSVITVLCC